MTRLVLDSRTEALLAGLTETAEVVDDSGRVIGFFLPVSAKLTPQVGSVHPQFAQYLDLEFTTKLQFHLLRAKQAALGEHEQ